MIKIKKKWNYKKKKNERFSGAGLAEWPNRQLIDLFFCLFIKGLTCQCTCECLTSWSLSDVPYDVSLLSVASVIYLPSSKGLANPKLLNCFCSHLFLFFSWKYLQVYWFRSFVHTYPWNLVVSQCSCLSVSWRLWSEYL